MLTRRFTLAVLVGGLLAAACGQQPAPAASAKASPAVPAGITAYGFSNVMATLKFKPGQAGTITSGPITVQVPGDAFAVPVTFELLQGNDSYWQGYVPRGQQVVTDFAFRVLDGSGTLVASFRNPVLVTVTGPQVGPTTLYENTTATKPPKVEPNPLPSQIQGHILKHEVSAAVVGWVIADPAA